jgi:hypothetical protein
MVVEMVCKSLLTVNAHITELTYIYAKYTYDHLYTYRLTSQTVTTLSEVAACTMKNPTDGVSFWGYMLIALYRFQ